MLCLVVLLVVLLVVFDGVLYRVVLCSQHAVMAPNFCKQIRDVRLSHWIVFLLLCLFACLLINVLLLCCDADVLRCCQLSHCAANAVQQALQ